MSKLFLLLTFAFCASTLLAQRNIYHLKFQLALKFKKHENSYIHSGCIYSIILQ